MDDLSLLKLFTQERDEAAFTKLVGRHLGMVYGVVYRRTGNRELAEELTQNVFTALARKADTISSGVNLPGWLHRAAVLESSQALRSEYRRQRKMKTLSEYTDGDATVNPESWCEVLPVLDEVIDQLNVTERRIVLMRFVEERTLRQIGNSLGKSEAATQRHLRRILDKLALLLRKRGVSATTALLATCLSAEFTQAAPSTLLPSIISKGAFTATAGAKAIALTTTTTLSMSKGITLTGVGVLLVAAVTTGSIHAGKSKARRELSASLTSASTFSTKGRTTVSSAEEGESRSESVEANRVTGSCGRCVPWQAIRSYIPNVLTKCTNWQTS